MVPRSADHQPTGSNDVCQTCIYKNKQMMLIIGKTPQSAEQTTCHDHAYINDNVILMCNFHRYT